MHWKAFDSRVEQIPPLQQVTGHEFSKYFETAGR